MSKSMTEIKAMLNLGSFNVNDAPYYYGCKVCGNKFKTQYGQYNHIDRKDHRGAVLNEMNEIITKENKLGDR
jgi:hypothetical protein